MDTYMKREIESMYVHYMCVYVCMCTSKYRRMCTCICIHAGAAVDRLCISKYIRICTCICILQVLLWIDRAFTCAFALELAVNLYANFFWDFVTDGWSMFDMLVVCVSFYAAFARDGMHIYACTYVRMYVCVCVCIHTNNTSHIHTLLVVCASCYAALARDGMHMCVHMTHVNVCAYDLCMYTHIQGAFPVSHIRLMRAFRIIRIFGQLKAIKAIVNAITASINAVLYAFFIMGVITSLYAIIGVSLFSTDAEEQFGNLR